MSRQNVYEHILDTYDKSIDEGRILLYNNMGVLMRRNPILKMRNGTYTAEDIKSEAFMLADSIILNKDIPQYKKIARLWYLFNRWGGALFDKINQYSSETYTIDEGIEENVSTYLNDDILNWILVVNNVITPMEEKILSLLKEWRGKYEIARMMRTSYYNIRSIVETLSLKIDRFIKENDIDGQ